MSVVLSIVMGFGPYKMHMRIAEETLAAQPTQSRPPLFAYTFTGFCGIYGDVINYYIYKKRTRASAGMTLNCNRTDS